MNDADPRLVLARRLRALREDQWPDLKITQAQLAQALGGEKPLSVPLISSWETQASPKIPPLSRLDAYAALFATRRSFTGDVPQPIEAADMTDAERQAMAEIKRELTQMRAQAMGATTVIGPEGYTGPEADRLGGLAASLNSGLWRFADGDTVTVVCAQFPKKFRAVEKYTVRNSPDYIELYTYSELDALFELFGHLRAANPVNQIDLRLAEGLARDVYSSHLITLGGIDWNATTSSVLNRLKLPVKQVADWGEDNPETTTFILTSPKKAGGRRSTGPNIPTLTAGENWCPTSRYLSARAILLTVSGLLLSAAACTAVGHTAWSVRSPMPGSVTGMASTCETGLAAAIATAFLPGSRWSTELR